MAQFSYSEAGIGPSEGQGYQKIQTKPIKTTKIKQ